jgi:hypothetical protein
MNVNTVNTACVLHVHIRYRTQIRNAAHIVPTVSEKINRYMTSGHVLNIYERAI